MGNSRNEMQTVPTVTEDDLRFFHTRHFGPSPIPNDFFVGQPEAEYEEDDGLGYYADGVKRTLTDDQVAMFRHSEVQAILRERRLEREMTPEDNTPAKDIEVQVPEKIQAPSTTSKSRKGTGGDQASSQNKRKWDNFIDDSETNPEHLTHRRMARELDELRQDAVELLYGEEEGHGVSPQAHKADAGLDAPIHLRRPTFQWPTLGAGTSG